MEQQPKRGRGRPPKPAPAKVVSANKVDGIVKHRKTQKDPRHNKNSAPRKMKGYGDFKAGVPITFETESPRARDAQPLFVNGIPKEGFKLTIHGLNIQKFKQLRQNRNRTAQPPAIQAMKNAAEIVSNAFDHMDSFLKEKGLTWWDWCEWFYAQGLVDTNPMNVRRWGRNWPDRLLSDELYMLGMVSVYTNIPMRVLMSPKENR